MATGWHPGRLSSAGRQLAAELGQRRAADNIAAVACVRRLLPDLALRWPGARVLVIGHVAMRWALDHYLNGQPLAELLRRDFTWQEG